MNRRKIIKAFLSGLILPLVPVKIDAAAKKSGRRLILIELSGANDGLNTVIPYSDDRYYGLRPELAIKKNESLTITDDFSLHPALKDFVNVFEDNDVAIIHGLGYPGANRSHFKSIALWETGGDGSASGRSGWLTEDIEDLKDDKDLDAHGISLDGGMGVFTSPDGIWLSMTSANQFLQLSENQFVLSKKTKNPSLNLLLNRALDLNTSMDRISQKLSASFKYPKSRVNAGDLGRQLSSTARLIAAGINTPIFKVKIDGFDTHENQLWRHNDLLRNLGNAISGFKKQMVELGEWENTLVFTYSEFGRRAIENFNKGTDHGTAAPHFLIGGKVNGGIYGNHPDLGNLIEGDMKYTLDYRAIYELILGKWFSIQDNKFKSFRSEDLNKKLIL